MKKTLLCALGTGLLCGTPDGASAHDKITHIVALKSEGRVMLRSGEKVVKAYPAWFGLLPGSKKREGDYKTPIGEYVLSPGRRSDYHWFMPINYPNREDVAAGRTGSDIGLHGTGQVWARRFGKWFRAGNWTKGCIAVSDEHIDEIRKLIGRRSIPIRIKP